jgi:hypothetical protein
MVNRSKEFETRRRERVVDGEGEFYLEFAALRIDVSSRGNRRWYLVWSILWTEDGSFPF